MSSLLLAAAIACLVTCAVMWKRRRRAARKSAEMRDVEKKVGGAGADDGEETEDEGNDVGDGGEVRSRRSRTRSMRANGSSATLAEVRNSGQKFPRGAVELWKTRARWTWLQKKKGRRRPNGAANRSRDTLQVTQREEDAEGSGSASGVEVHVTPARSSISGTRHRQRPRTDRHETDEDVLDVPNVAPRRSVDSSTSSSSSLSLVSSSRSMSDTRQETSTPQSDNTPALSAAEPDANIEPISVPIPTVQSPAYEERDDALVGGAPGPPAYRSHSGARSGSMHRARRRERAIRTGDITEKGDYVGELGDYVQDSEEELESRVATERPSDLEAEESESRDGEGTMELNTRQARGRETAQMHVATDDKQELARLAERASAPTLQGSLPSQPASSSSSIPELNRARPSAPEPEALFPPADADDLDTTSLDSPGAGPGPSSTSHLPHTHSRSLALPPPPSQQHAYDYSDYADGFDDLDLGGGDAALGLGCPFPSPPPAFSSSFSPSAPPLEGTDSSPGEDGDNNLRMEPSAPPLEFEDVEAEVDNPCTGASAPPLEVEDFGRTHALSTVRRGEFRTGEIDEDEWIDAVR